MSKADLDWYWAARAGVRETVLRNYEANATTSAGLRAVLEFLHIKKHLDDDLKRRDERAYRALTHVAQCILGEVSAHAGPPGSPLSPGMHALVNAIDDKARMFTYATYEFLLEVEEARVKSLKTKDVPV
jgi:hypothetical protein